MLASRSCRTPNSKASTSSASGLTQFLDATWLEQACRPSTYLNQTAKENGFVGGDNKVVLTRRSALLNLRFDPILSIVAAEEYGLFNLNELEKAGSIEDDLGDDEKAYLAHHEGLAGAKAYIANTASYSFAKLATQVGQPQAQFLTQNAHGDTTRAY